MSDALGLIVGTLAEFCVVEWDWDEVRAGEVSAKEGILDRCRYEVVN